jgi:hypothetical protein
MYFSKYFTAVLTRDRFLSFSISAPFTVGFSDINPLVLRPETACFTSSRLTDSKNGEN